MAQLFIMPGHWYKQGQSLADQLGPEHIREVEWGDGTSTAPFSSNILTIPNIFHHGAIAQDVGGSLGDLCHGAGMGDCHEPAGSLAAGDPNVACPP